ncbi:hypothetical protein [Paraburkholderia saeva]|uniref:hypothetical protein n=1 Tax=Paraburkholderia saeva TaxID=2777537 RepID=UPI001D246205|nr:hypothetical protein [Paraburkholderia saeva]CAG4887819.1 hypothetical protein R52603_00518 [Paraburkholderia saeva]
MQIQKEKILEAIATLHAAEAALLACDSEDGSNGALAGRCVIAAVYLETAIAQAELRHFVIAGDRS